VHAKKRRSEPLAHMLRSVVRMSVVLSCGFAKASVSCVDCDAPRSRPVWTWLENCHVERAHRLTDFGTSGSLLVTGDNQTIVSHVSAGKNRTGYPYIATLKQDLWSGGELIAYANGGISCTLDNVIGDRLGTNGLAAPADLYVSRLFLLQTFSRQHAQAAVGRLDLSDFFDTNRVANCEVTQFLSDSLVNNPAIPFPQAGIGAAARLSLASWAYMQAGAADSSAIATESGLNTAFDSSDHLFSIVELGVSPFPMDHPGEYRFIFWHDSSSGDEEPHANHGFAISFDQSATDDVTLFLRYGSADSPVGGLSSFWSFGARRNRPLAGRNRDFLQCGLALGDTSGRTEKLAELDYHLRVNDDVAVTPLVQIVWDPAQRTNEDTTVIAGLRLVYVL
jgi:carbohydrate-selective porin OprB